MTETDDSIIIEFVQLDFFAIFDTEYDLVFQEPDFVAVFDWDAAVRTT